MPDHSNHSKLMTHIEIPRSYRFRLHILGVVGTKSLGTSTFTSIEAGLVKFPDEKGDTRTPSSPVIAAATASSGRPSSSSIGDSTIPSLNHDPLTLFGRGGATTTSLLTLVTVLLGGQTSLGGTLGITLDSCLGALAYAI